MDEATGSEYTWLAARLAALGMTLVSVCLAEIF